MSSSIHWKKNIRKASYEDALEIRKHLLSLDEDSVKKRFGNIVTRAFIQQYIETIFALDSVVFLCEFDGFVRGIGELRPLTRDKLAAEATFTVDAPFRDLGIGTALMAATIEEASRKGVREVFSCFDAGNRGMACIAEKFRGGIARNDGDCIARIAIEDSGRPRTTRLRLKPAVQTAGVMAKETMGDLGRLVASALRQSSRFSSFAFLRSRTPAIQTARRQRQPSAGATEVKIGSMTSAF